MKKRTNKYWKHRFILLTESLLNKSEDYYNDLEGEYERAIAILERDIRDFYIRFAENNEITMTEARRILNNKELKEFYWTVEEYIQKGKENAVDQRWIKELENTSTRVRLSRLQSLQYQIRQQAELITAKRLHGLTKLSEELIKEGYYRSIYEVQKGFGIGDTFTILDTKTVESIIAKPWAPDGSNFSERIWRDREVLVNELQKELAQSFIRGDAPDKSIRNISKKMEVSKRVAGRLVMTESAFFANEARAKAFKELGVEEFQFLSTLDMRTSVICQDMDLRIFKLSEREIGVNWPPLHCWCRSTAVPYFEGNIKQRWARDPKTGKGYYVPGDIKYKEWYKEHVEGKYGKDETRSMENKIKNRDSDREQHEKYKLIFGDKIPSKFDDFQELKYNNIREWEEIKAKKQDTLNSLDYRDSFFGRFGNKEVREWYITHDKNIPNLIDKSKDIEAQAREAHGLRNKYRTEARNMMMDQVTRAELDKESPNKSFDELLDYKMGKKNITREEAIKDIIKTATKTNKKVNKSLGLE